MIEIPEAINLSKQLDQIIKGKKIRKIIANHTPHGLASFNMEPSEFSELFNDEVVIGTDAYGGKLHIKLSSGGDLLFCDGVNMRYYSEGEPPNKHQLLIEFNNLTFLVCKISLYGWIYGFKGPYQCGYDETAKIKPNVLSDQFNMDYFLGILDNIDSSKTSVKAFLASNQNIPGLGNGVLQDILFNAALKPRRKINTLKQDDLEAIYLSIRNTIFQMIQGRGRNTEKDLFGNPGRYKTIMSKFAYKSPCPRCGGTIKKEAYLGGTVYYCMSCQY